MKSEAKNKQTISKLEKQQTEKRNQGQSGETGNIWHTRHRTNEC
jgi:hypothetical protein